MTWKSSFLSKLIYYDCIIKCVVSENSTTLRIFLGKFHFVHSFVKACLWALSLLIINYVDYLFHCTFQSSPAALAKEVLAEVPKQLTEFFRARNILPQQRPT